MSTRSDNIEWSFKESPIPELLGSKSPTNKTTSTLHACDPCPCALAHVPLPTCPCPYALAHVPLPMCLCPCALAHVHMHEV